MKTAQATLSMKVEFCEHSQPLNNFFVCSISDYGYSWRCTKEEKKTCPDLEADE